MPNITAAQVKVLRRLCERASSVLDLDAAEDGVPDETMMGLDTALTDGYGLLETLERAVTKGRQPRSRRRRVPMHLQHDDTPSLDTTFHDIEMNV